MIELSNVNKIYNETKSNSFQALTNINLTIQDNDFIILKGISGSGKSTLLSIIASLEKPTSGEVMVDDEVVSKLPDIHSSRFRSQKIGFVFQEFNLFDNLSVFANISIPLIPLGFDPYEIEIKVSKILKDINILHKKDQNVNSLSGGEKQRVAIARSMVNNPKILLCDEPTAALDENNSKNLVELLVELNKKGITIIVATHDTIFENSIENKKVINIKNGMIIE